MTDGLRGSHAVTERSNIRLQPTAAGGISSAAAEAER